MKRYSLNSKTGEMVPDPNGKWMLAEDVLTKDLLIEANVFDLEIGTLLVDMMVDKGNTVHFSVDWLIKNKPFLFKKP